MKKLFYILFASLYVISCSSDNDPIPPIDNEVVVKEGKHVFRIATKALSAKTVLEGTQKNLEPAFALISINDSDGSSIFVREKLALTKSNESYITAEVPLAEGTYALTEFIVTDENEVLISLAPQENSVLAQFASSPLPFDFTISPDETKVTVAENIGAAGYTSVDFGYTGLTLTFPENTDFFSMTVDDSEAATTKVLNLKSITGSTYLVDWGDGTIDEYVSTINNSGIENTISHDYTENGVFTITVSGAIEAIELLDFGSNQENNFESHLTEIDIDKLILLKSCQLYLGQLTGLNTSENKALEFLGLGYNQVTSLDFTDNPNLKSVWLRYNALTEINISQNPNLEFLWVDGNQISTIDVSTNTKLKVVLARENNLGSIDFSSNMVLERFDLADNTLSNIDISSNLALMEINVGANNLTSIDLSNNAELVRVDLYTNLLTSIDLSANQKLRDLYIENNMLTEIDLSTNPLLERLIIGNNDLSSLDTTNNPEVFDLQINGNQFDGTSLDQIISQVYDQAVVNTISNGFINYTSNPGTEQLANTTIAKLNELVLDYDWAFIGN
ncbi:leucine-rich repeat domain-containing protein [Maribacter sp. 2307UL18-2]|uniref:leucine-rich repeat domain-containing protein n=1 Tax=Maribacter sp. 2307UL18-2 TaxID=3386274 RepID=UPI0039BD0E5B